jgi:hypothetical protein
MSATVSSRRRPGVSTYHFIIHHEDAEEPREEDVEASCEHEARDLAMLRLMFGRHVSRIEARMEGGAGFSVSRDESTGQGGRERGGLGR